MNINTYLVDEDETEDEKCLKEYRKMLYSIVTNGYFNTLQYSYFLEFEKCKGTINNIQWYIDTIELINCEKTKEEFKKLSANVFKKFFRYKDNIFRLNKDIEYNSTRLDTIDFTDEQKKAVKQLINVVINKNIKTYGLYGYAGTGKTTTVVEFVSYLLKNKFINSVCFTAPTNKAVNVIKSKFRPHISNIIKTLFKIDIGDTFNFDDQLDFLEENKIKIDFITIHKLLNFQTDYSVSGETIFIRDKKKGSLILDFEICIIDECSMITLDMIDNIFQEIRMIIQHKGNNFQKSPKIIFTGDPAQLPPVNEENSSIFIKKKEELSFENYMDIMNYKISQSIVSDSEAILKEKYEILLKDVLNMDSFLLQTVVRSKIDNVTKLCNEFREWVKRKKGIPELNKFIGLDGVHFYEHLDSCSKIKNVWFEKFIEATKSGVSTIILTWTNRQTDIYNETIRKVIFNKKNLQKYEKNDILMLGDFYNLDLGEKMVKQKLYTSEQIKVVETKLTEVPVNRFELEINTSLKKIKNYNKIEDKLKLLIFGINKTFLTNVKFKAWVLYVHKIGEDSKNTMTIISIDDESKESYNKIKDGISNIIKNFSREMVNLHKNAPRQIEKHLIKPLWKQYNKIFIEPFATINYGYSITCHKAQGSNFYDVFVDIDDILQNKRNIEAKKCAYTAVTRTINKIHMLV